MEVYLYDKYISYLEDSTPNPNNYSNHVIRTAKQYEVHHERLWKKNGEKLTQVVTKDAVEGIIKLVHSSPLGGHFATDKTFDKIRADYYWPGMRENIKTFIKGCDACQKRKQPERSQKMKSIPPSPIMQRWHIDMIGPLPKTANGNTLVIVAIESFTKWAEALAIPNKEAETTAKFIYDNVICRYGFMDQLVSDGDKTFDNKLIKHLLEKKCGIKHIIITPHHPQGNGQVERFIRILKEAIAKQVDDRVNCWDDALPAALMACRTTPSSTTGYTPYYLMHGREATMPVHVKMPLIGRIDLSDLDARIGQLVKLGTDWVVAEQNTRKKQKQQKGQHNKAVKETRYEIGEKVWVELTARRGQFDKKLHTKWDGPFYIATVFDNGTYQEGMKPNSEPKRKPIHGN